MEKMYGKEGVRATHDEKKRWEGRERQRKKDRDTDRESTNMRVNENV